jgi:hypothetical protein
MPDPRPQRPSSGPPRRREHTRISRPENRTPRTDRRAPSREADPYDAPEIVSGPPWRQERTGRRRPVRRSRFRVPGWLVVAVAIFLAAGGLALGEPYFQISVVIGSVLAAVVVERSAFFAAAIQPPLITAIVAAGAVLLGLPWLDAAVQVAQTFPYLVGTMVAVLTILFVRGRVSPARRA